MHKGQLIWKNTFYLHQQDLWNVKTFSSKNLQQQNSLPFSKNFYLQALFLEQPCNLF